MPPLLEAEHARKVFRGGGMLGTQTETVAVEDFSVVLSDDAPTFLTIAGESGSGKTTIARLLLGVTPPSSGAVRYRGQDVAGLDRAQTRRFRQDVQAIFQDPFEVYNPFYKIDHILTTPIRKFGLASGAEEARRMICGALETVGLRPDETLGRYPHQLSGGQRQRITIARALLLKPRLIIADEPVSMVDASLRATILESLRTLYQDFGISFVYITHDLTTAYQVSQHILVLYRGAVVEIGDVESVIRSPAHPYTQELIGSIPVPNPDTAWIGTPVAAPVDERQDDGPQGCRYAPRCAHADDACRASPPPLYRADPDRAAACYLYRERPALAMGDLGAVMGPDG